MPRSNEPLDVSTFAGRVGANIRRLRERNKLTGEEAAARAGVPKPTWFHWENGKVTLNRLPQIAKVLGCAPRDLIPTK